MKWPIVIQVGKPDGRAWVSIACFVLVLVMLVMMWADRSLLRDDFFKTIATALIITAWLNGPVGWAFQATKGGGELADQNAALVRQNVESNPPIANDPPAPSKGPTK